MDTETLAANHTLRQHLRASRVDAAAGVIYGATVAKAGVQATGKTLFLDSKGAITRDEKLAARKLPVFTDDKTLDTLMAAAAGAGPRVKVREDHDDSLGARAGYASAFVKTTDGRVTTDLRLFQEYRNRALVLETATETPSEIGLSIDFRPSFEIVGDKALMRVEELYAVDIVDEGAITPGGLLLSAGVDTTGKKETQNGKPEPTAQMPTNEEIMAALKELAGNVGACMAAVSKLTAAPAPAAPTDAMAAFKDVTEKLSLQVTQMNDQLKVVIADNAKLKKERALLGFRGTPSERAAAAAAPGAEDIERMAANRKDYLALVREHREKTKCSAAAAHSAVQKTEEGAAAYALHLSARGVVRENMAA